MNELQQQQVQSKPGFFAALDQSGGSTRGALKLYGISEDVYGSDEKLMFTLMHEMRSRIVTSPGFNGDRVIGAILFEDTMDREFEGRAAAEYLWDVKHVVPFLKVDRGLLDVADGVQLMRPMPDLEIVLQRAREKGIFGTKMRSFIKLADAHGVQAIVDQQFAVAKQILAMGLVPILEPEIDIHSPEKGAAEELLKSGLLAGLDSLAPGQQVMVKISLPEEDDFYTDLMNDPRLLRVVALSGGYSRQDADALLARNHGLIASFSRALTEGLTVQQSDAEFHAALDESINDIFSASIS
jgi:fructose-bisphosphate aldolase class I